MAAEEPRPKSKRAAVEEFVSGRERFGEADFAELLACLAPVSPGYVRRLLRASAAALDPVVEGVRQDSPEQLERTLIALQREYEESVRAGDRDRVRRVRAIVIEAKDHARLASRSKPGKAEMVSTMLVWLENPPVFSLWAAARRRAG